jgi:hypothetical protein
MAVGATTIQLTSNRNAAQENPILLGAMPTCRVVNLTRNLGQVGLDVGVAGQPEDTIRAGLQIPDGRQGSESSLDGSGVGQKGRNRAF